VATGAPLLAAALVDRIEVAGRGTCRGALDGASLVEGDGLSLTARYDCGGDPGPLTVRVGFLDAVSTGHRHLAAGVRRDGTHERVVVYEARPTFEVTGGASPTGSGVVLPLLRLGVQHILTGYDHLVFLLGLVLVGGRLRSLLVVVTAFTLAHSVTLAMAA